MKKITLLFVASLLMLIASCSKVNEDKASIVPSDKKTTINMLVFKNMDDFVKTAELLTDKDNDYLDNYEKTNSHISLRTTFIQKSKELGYTVEPYIYNLAVSTILNENGDVQIGDIVWRIKEDVVYKTQNGITTKIPNKASTLYDAQTRGYVTCKPNGANKWNNYVYTSNKRVVSAISVESYYFGNSLVGVTANQEYTYLGPFGDLAYAWKDVKASTISLGCLYNYTNDSKGSGKVITTNFSTNLQNTSRITKTLLSNYWSNYCIISAYSTHKANTGSVSLSL